MRRGDIVLVDFPFATTGGGTKVRPSLVIQSDRNNARLQDTIVAIITSTKRYFGPFLARMGRYTNPKR